MWEKLKRVPIGVWAALGVALTLLGLYLRGRRLDAELARAKLQRNVADARAAVAKDQGAAEVHLERARAASRRIESIQSARELATMSGVQEEKRLAALKPDQVHEEYMKLLERKRIERGFDLKHSEPPDISIAEHLEAEKKKTGPLPYEE